MKRLLFLTTVLCILLAGCSEGKTKPIELSEKADNSGMRAVYFLDEGRSFPLSIANDGKQMLEKGVYWHYELNDLCSFEAEEEFFLYDTQTKLPIKKATFDAFSKENGYAVNGEWQAFFAPIHTEYGKDNQDAVDEQLIATARRLLDANKMNGAEVTVTDVWSFDLDGDAVDECFFKACNCNMLDDEEHASYCILGYVDGEACQTLYGDYSKKAVETEKTRQIEPIICDPEGDGIWSVWVYKSGDFKSVTSFDFEDGNFSRCYEIIF